MSPDREPTKDLLAPFWAERDHLLLPVVRWLNNALTGRARMRAALLLIGQGGCDSFTSGHCERAGRTRGAYYAGEGWCEACIANAALRLPRDRQAWKAVPRDVG